LNILTIFDPLIVHLGADISNSCHFFVMVSVQGSADKDTCSCFGVLCSCVQIYGRWHRESKWDTW